jgi:hydrogenase maturation protein HypF
VENGDGAMTQLAAGEPTEGWHVRVRGLVQGVGFRPTVWRLARDCGISGDVRNDAEGVVIRAWGMPAALDDFIRRLREDAPPLARVDRVERTPLGRGGSPAGFCIAASRGGAVQTGVVPDAATCEECRAEIAAEGRRRGYPFTNCTHCGPRFSILRAIPYDRANTSMAAFALCSDCRGEYDSPADRRFHAQPLACPDCGPSLWLEELTADANVVARDAAAIEAAGARLMAGAIVAVKGIGGFHLACDAGNDDAVARLRARKRRYDKPFALMARDVETVRRYCRVGRGEEALLCSTAAPIVVMAATGPDRLADAVAPGQSTLGFMLPYTPLHHLLLARVERPVVLTSGNLSEEPQCTGNGEARHKLAAIADCALFHDRDIVNRIDDSVARVLGGEVRVLRRARGYAPAPLVMPEGFEAHPPVLAFGAELKNTFCLVKDGQAVLSQHVGDLEDAATFAEYRRGLTLYRALFEHRPEVLAVDRHPQYLSTRLGRDWADRDGLRLAEVQHHHAHIASCMTENGVALGAPPVLGIALDGLGYGDDSSFWGGEFLIADYAGFTRAARLAPVAMPGGAQAVREPWRNTFAHLEAALGWERCAGEHPRLDIVRFMATQPVAALKTMIRDGINSPSASSCGRLFDAVAAALGICRVRAGYEGQAAIELEALVDERALGREPGYPFALDADECPAGATPAPLTLASRPMWEALLRDLGDGTPAAVVAARFHRGLADAVVETAARVAGDIDTAALSGGVFQNRVLLELVSDGLRGRGFKVLSPHNVPANDGGLSLGQAAVAVARQALGAIGAAGQAIPCV